MALPETTSRDLISMGQTAQFIREYIERVDGKRLDGELIGHFFPPDGWRGKYTRARNHLKYDWKLVESHPPTVVKESTYNQTFLNFEGENEVKFDFNHTVTETTGEDYSQTRAFDISVNANIPLGKSGALIGFTANMSGSDVKGKSSSKTDSRTVMFPYIVPAHEGRNIVETTTINSKETAWQSALHVKGSVGIELDPGWWKPNYYVIFYTYDSDWFANSEAQSRITRATITTNIVYTFFKVPKSGNIEGTEDEVLELRTSYSPDATYSQEEVPAKDFGVDTRGSQYADLTRALEYSDEPKEINLGVAPATLTVRIQYTGGGINPEIPEKDRQKKSEAFKSAIHQHVHPIGTIGTITYGPHHGYATFTIPYDKQQITKEKIIQQSLAQAVKLNWGGGHTINWA